jgi:UDP-glucuronate decarboxylase
MRKILITGGAGFIASSLAEKLIQEKENYVVIIDNLSTGHIGKIPKSNFNNLKFIKGDVNRESVISEIMLSYKFDYVFHYAAVVGVQRTLDNPLAVLNDISGIKNILELSRNTGVKRVFYSSSSEIYGEPVFFPQNEHTTPLNSKLPYAIVKNVGEAYLRSYFREYGLEYTIFRFFNAYGSKQSKTFVISRFLSQALKNEDIYIYGDGLQPRTFFYIDDNINACLNAFYNNLFVNDVVNIGSDIQITINDLAKLIVRLSKSKSVIKHLPPLEEGDMRGRLPDVSKMQRLLNNKPLSIEEGISKIISAGLFETQLINTDFPEFIAREGINATFN